MRLNQPRGGPVTGAWASGRERDSCCLRAGTRRFPRPSEWVRDTVGTGTTIGLIAALTLGARCLDGTKMGYSPERKSFEDLPFSSVLGAA